MIQENKSKYRVKNMFLFFLLISYQTKLGTFSLLKEKI